MRGGQRAQTAGATKIEVPWRVCGVAARWCALNVCRGRCCAISPQVWGGVWWGAGVVRKNRGCGVKPRAGANQVARRSAAQQAVPPRLVWSVLGGGGNNAEPM